VRILVVSDVHANLAAFSAVLEAADQVDFVWSLGDLVGYGPEPAACIDLLRVRAHVAVAGNHELAVSGGIGVQDFNPIAAAAALWTSDALSDADTAWLRDLPPVAEQEGFTLVHGSLRDPVWEYLDSDEVARAQLRLQGTPYSFVGHTHLPLLCYEGGRLDWAVEGQTVALDGRRFVANPGSVGQPRDGDPRAAYAIVDTEAAVLSFHRVAYDVAATQAGIRAAGLPELLAARLAQGR
jgi:diadenosine tetraphosphatase ApaH/serine/threonine PP2A family protein phosphatase